MLQPDPVGQDAIVGIVTLFCPGSTGGLTTIEHESGAVADLQQAFDEIAPPDRDYRHHQRWGDDGNPLSRDCMAVPTSARRWSARR